MRKTVRTALCGLALHAAALLTVGPAAAGECTAKALDILKVSSANGYAIFRQAAAKAFFRNWLDCEDAQFGLPTAVHETVHLVTGTIDAYPLIGGGTVKRPAEDGALFAPARIARHFKPSLFVSTYLQPGSASSADDFRYLLDELNAYTHDLDTALALDDLRDPDNQPAHRDGLAATMSFVALYVEAAQSDPAAWSALRRPETLTAVSTLWRQAERAMVASCRIPGLGLEDQDFLGKLCARRTQTALGQLLGRAPVCPRSCISAEARAADRE